MSPKTPSSDNPEADLAIFGGPGESPEKNLMVAIVTRAKLDLFHSNKQRSEMALTWFLSKDVKDLHGRPWLLSFESICNQLDSDPDIVRRAILKQSKSP